MSVLSSLIGDYADDIVKGASKVAANNTDDLAKVLAKKSVNYARGDSLTDIANRLRAMNEAGQIDNTVKRIGSDKVAQIVPESLPRGYNTLSNYLREGSNNRVSKAIGAAIDDDSFASKLASFVENEGYDVSKNPVDNLQTVRQILYEKTADDLNMEGASGYSKFLQTRGKLQHDNPLMGIGPDSFTISANDDMLYQTEAAKLDREFSDRLGIGRSHTPMSDKVLSSDAQGYYMGGGIGINPYHAVGENGVSTIAHERLHAMQDINPGEWDEGVGKAINDLRNELSEFRHTKDQIKNYRKSASDLDYYSDVKEQEARMLQSYLDNEGFTNSWRKRVREKPEWGVEVKPAFDKFFGRLRELSGKGIALPAVGGVVGGGSILSSLLNNNQGKEG